MPVLPRSRRGIWLLAATTFFLAACSSKSQQSSVARTNVKEILSALNQYRSEHDTLPYDQRGPEFALYQLRSYLSASCFDASNDKPVEIRAAWNDTERRLTNSDFEYLNEEPGGDYENRIVLMSRSQNGGTTYYGYADGSRYGRDFPATPDRRILGCWITVDDFLVEGKSLYESVARTHVVSGKSWTTYSEGKTLRSAMVDGLNLNYRYSATGLSHCTIRTERGAFEEDFETDNLGRITGCTRSPANWAEFLP
jgi:hypothetical protein